MRHYEELIILVVFGAVVIIALGLAGCESYRPVGTSNGVETAPPQSYVQHYAKVVDAPTYSERPVQCIIINDQRTETSMFQCSNKSQ